MTDIITNPVFGWHPSNIYYSSNEHSNKPDNNFEPQLNSHELVIFDIMLLLSLVIGCLVVYKNSK